MRAFRLSADQGGPPLSAPELRDTADLIDPGAYDPEPAEITDPNHPDHVESDPDATPIREEEDQP